MASALSNRQNRACARKTLHTRGRTHGAGCVRQWLRTAEPLGERRNENWNTHVGPVIPCRQSYVPSHGFENGNLCALFYHMCECLQDGRNIGGRMHYVQHDGR